MGNAVPLHPAGRGDAVDQGWSPGPGCEEPTPHGARVPEGGAIPRSEARAAGTSGQGVGGRCGLFRRVCAPEGRREEARWGRWAGNGLRIPTPSHPNLPASWGSDETDPGAKDRGLRAG